ncbi:MAG: oligosaccharide flippase family protein [Candidatus Latescibacteria bacterium]|nr:oligosaccharide flippase family protein [bacterium]MBD3423374.1 oligosaccharide flippase family protein [Candidatus Latescibacterota bacterium]
MKLLYSIRSWFMETIRRKAVKHLGFIYSSRAVSAVLRFVVSIIVVRTLGAESFGVLTIATVIMGISARVIELGLTTTMVRKLSLHLSEGDDQRAVSIFKRIYTVRIQVSVVFVVLAWFLSPVVAVRVYGNPELVWPLRMASFGALMYNMYYHSEGVLRAYEKFKQVAVVSIAGQAVRTICVLALAYFSVLNVETTMAANLAQIFIGFLVASFLIPSRLYREKSVVSYPLREISSYSGWMFLFIVLFMVFDRLDVLMLGYYRAATQVGIYSVAFILVKPFELIPETFNTVFLPKVSKFKKKFEIFRYFRDTIKVTALIAVMGLVIIFIARPIVVTFYGDDFIPSVRLFQILIGAFVLLTVINPINLVAHTINKPQLFSLMAAINLILNFTGNLIFIPPYGALGAAIVTLISRVLGGLIGLLILKFSISRWVEVDDTEIPGEN